MKHPSGMNVLVLCNFICIIDVFFVLPACLCATDFPTMRIFRESLIPARSRPPQQDLQHLTTPHDCHHLCVTFTAGNCPTDGCSRRWASGNQRNMRIIFFLDTMGMCRMYPVNFNFFPHQSFFLSSGIFVLLKRTQGWTKPESVLFDHFSAVFLFIGVLF